MKMKKLAAALCAAICTAAPLHALADSAVPRVYRILLWEGGLLFDRQNDRWYDLEGNPAVLRQPIQQARCGDALYTVNLEKMKVYDENGDECPRLTQVLAVYDTMTQQRCLPSVIYDETIGDWVNIESSRYPVNLKFDPTNSFFYADVYLDQVRLQSGIDYFGSADDPEELAFDCTMCLADSLGDLTAEDFCDTGDVDLSGKVNVGDAVQLARIAAGDPEADVSELGRALADINGDSELDDMDLTALLRTLARLD